VTLTLEQIAKLSDGELEGDPETKITGAASLAEATVHEISFFNNPRYLAQLRKTRAAAVIVPRDFAEQIGVAVIRTSDPAKAFEQVVTKFAPPPIKFAPGIHPPAGEIGRSHLHSTVGGNRSRRANWITYGHRRRELHRARCRHR
jgi:UDP-3-O-[3-hydroxymyristoyl] glucosamine N-acyltransferase